MLGYKHPVCLIVCIDGLVVQPIEKISGVNTTRWNREYNAWSMLTDGDMRMTFERYDAEQKYTDPNPFDFD